ncbi:hypothetical protein V6x_32070 [Gimesia chilikensis]|uniref:Uncharacterized protein n=1 Tax=Gimesia chilikensis TaxID=2605989 RepID=A0A517WE05_9PLAN|nr:hypothetical protein V6x_32070 [Gimesia chilikensis]
MRFANLYLCGKQIKMLPLEDQVRQNDVGAPTR